MVRLLCLESEQGSIQRLQITGEIIRSKILRKFGLTYLKRSKRKLRIFFLKIHLPISLWCLQLVIQIIFPQNILYLFCTITNTKRLQNSYIKHEKLKVLASLLDGMMVWKRIAIHSYWIMPNLILQIRANSVSSVNVLNR